MDSGDELGGYDPATPAPAKKVPPKGPARPANRAVAGPSKPAGSAAVSKKGPVAAPEVNAPNAPDVVILSSDEEPRKATRKEPAVKSKGKEPRPTATANPNGSVNIGAVKAGTLVNGKSKGKGKAKTDSPLPADAMEVDHAQAAESDDPPARPPRANRNDARLAESGISPPPTKRHKSDSALEAEVARLHRRLDDVIAQRDRLSEQLKEALEVRESEPERLMAERVEQYEASLKAQEHLLEEQSRSLGRVGPLPDSAQAHALRFITQEAAAEQHKDLLEKNRRLEQQLKDQTAQNLELRAKNQQLEKQLEMEVRMATEYREKNGPTSKVALNGTSRSPVDGEVIKLYEDLTNFLITKSSRGEVKYPQFPDFNERTFNCTYTYIDGEVKASNPTIQFTLRNTWAPLDEAAPVTSRRDLKEKVEYVPVNLENEAEEFKDRLEFFKSAFTFERGQMHVFLKTLMERLSEANASGEEDQIDDNL